MEKTPVPLLTANDVASIPALVIDARPAEQFAEGHLDGAVHLDLWGVSLIDTSEAPLRAFMWMIGHLFSLRGVVPERPVVVYEQDAGIRAARVFWLLEYLGHPNAHVLDGGLDAWTRAGFPVTTRAVAPTPSEWHGTPDPSTLATWDLVHDRLGQGRDRDRRHAKRSGASGRAGPGRARRRHPRRRPSGMEEQPRAGWPLQISRELRAMYEQLGVTPDREVITYCQGGYRAAHAYLALRRLGYPRVRNYTGSWKEWGDRVDLPLERPGDQVDKYPGGFGVIRPTDVARVSQETGTNADIWDSAEHRRVLSLSDL